MGIVEAGSVEFAIDKIDAPYVKAVVDGLGNSNDLMVAVSLDEKSTWENGIFENSRYCRVIITDDGRCEVFVDSLFGHSMTRPFRRVRKWKSKDLPSAIGKINGYLCKVQEWHERTNPWK